ncbi:ABC transporter ATP-binding protein [Chromatiales bacterium (ex Bugula neritina AB1)]|nr:ABC transporter ATP-binding protein [Chromatiales bacterium (ex Bugula neritina AB1)]
MLAVSNLCTRYGSSQALFGMQLEVAAGEVVTLLGRNGMGKTTTINSIMGIVKPASGEITYKGKSISGKPPFVIAKQGLGLVPEGRQIFPNLTVRENLTATASAGIGKARKWTLDRVLAMFPQLQERLGSMGNLLSGGEQQMLAIGRALMINPDLLLLDDATEGLAPMVRKEIWASLAELKADGLSILVVDKNLNDLIALADRHYVVEKGKVAWTGDTNSLREESWVKETYLGV